MGSDVPCVLLAVLVSSNFSNVVSNVKWKEWDRSARQIDLQNK